MTQAFFYYQASVEDAWFLAPPVDLSWRQAGGQWQARLATTQSAQGNPAVFLAPPVDLSWLQTVGASARQVAALRSTRSDPSAFLSPPVPAVDVSWLALSGEPSRQTEAVASAWSDPALFAAPVVPVPDLSWLQSGGLVGTRQASSLMPQRSDPSVFLALVVADLSWLQQYATTEALVPVVASAQASTALFLPIAAAPDVSWAQSGGVGFPPARLATYGSREDSLRGAAPLIVPVVVTLRGTVFVGRTYNAVFEERT